MNRNNNNIRLNAQQQELLAYLLAEAGIESEQAAKISPRQNQDPVPLSFSQARMWFLDQLQPGSAYNIPAVVRIEGQVNVTALHQSLNEIVRRHEILRTTFTTINEQPVQVVHTDLILTLPLIDLDSHEQALQFVCAESQQLFDLAQGPLLSAKLLRLTTQEHILVLTMHHIVSDGWSLGVLVQELALLYEGFSTGTASLPQLPIQYADYALWQRQRLQGEMLETQLSYWKQQLAGSLPVLQLPTDRPRPPVQTFAGAKQALELPKLLSDAIANFSQQAGITPFITLLAAFKSLLYRYTGQEDIIVGSPVANRNRTETENLIGFFINTLVLRTDLGNNPTFMELLARERDVVLGGYDHQEMPFEKLVEMLPNRDMSHTPLFQVMFILQNAPMPTLEFSGLKLSPLKIDNQTAKFDLTLDLEETPNGICGCFEYNTDLFDASTIEQMARHFQVLLEGIIANPKQRLSDLPLLTPAEENQILVQWNRTTNKYPQDKCLHQLFETQVERTPDEVAVVFGDAQLTYRELNQRANQLAHHLRQLGVQPEVRVGICVERSLDLVVGIFGILKAGGAYIPLDPKYPQERLALMLSDAQAHVLLTHSQINQLPGNSTPVYLDTDCEAIDKQSSENPNHTVLPEHNAYVLYTSGSTGRPKAVVIEHRSTVAFLSWATNLFTFSDLAGVLAATSICFDLSVFELFAPLSCGGKVILVENALSLPSLSATQQVTLVNTVPSAIAELLRVNGIPVSVRTINLAGEPLAKKLVQQLYQNTSIQQVFNLYGPSEDTTYSTFSLVQPEDNIVSIGRPIANTQVYVLDRYLKPLPIGVPGELYLAGDGLARGYLNRPELTAEKFIPNPFNNRSHSRLYKTGDLVRYLPNGNLEYLGRLDNQVKIRGFRIELGEIEAVLRQYPGVQDVVVVAREDQPGQKRLVAYLVASLTVNALRSFLTEKLPEFMIPAAFVMLDTLPLTPNGKVDRRSLPAPLGLRQEAEVEYIAPGTVVEAQLASIWSDILGLEQVGINDNFFALGGHSLLATQVVSRVRDIFKVELPLRNLFTAPTVASLAAQIETISSSASSIQPIELASRNQIPLSFAQTRLWFLDQFDTKSAAYNITEALRMTGALKVEVLHQSLNEVVRRHEVLRTTFVTVEGQPTQVIYPSLILPLPIRDLSQLPETERQEEIQQLIITDAKQPFDLTQAPPIRAQLLRLADTEHLLLLNLHHIIADGWSMGVLVREVGALYQALSTGTSPLPELSVQYADFAVWQRQWLQGEVLEEQLSYWKQQLAGSSVLNLPTDYPRPVVQTFNGKKEALELPKILLDELKVLAQRENVTLFMTLLAAFQVLLHRYSQQDDITVGSPIANRNRRELEPLIGMFVNTLVLRTDLGGNPSFSELLQRVREVAMSAYAHQDLPFEKLVEVLSERDTSRNPLFQVMFVLQNASTAALELPGLKLELMPVENETAMFDLTLNLEETASGITGYFEYNTDLFDAATIQRMVGHFQTLLFGIAANPMQQIGNLPLLTAIELEQLLVGQIEPDEEAVLATVHEMFEQQVARTPNALALTLENQSLSYAELNRRANQVAHYLQKQGVAPETLVGICMKRSLDLLVGLLGILKAGGAYVPLDPAYPSDRLALMLEDGVSVLLTQERLLLALPDTSAKVVCLDADWQTIAECSTLNPNHQVTADNLAYIIYTSGSTGRPKGVAIEHRSLARYTRTAAQAYQIEASDRILQFASISFDASAEEIYPCLTRGATLVLRTDAMLGSVPEFLQTCHRWGITVLNLPTAYWHEITANLEPPTINLLATVRLVIIGGEQALPERLTKWQNSLSKSISLINTYGPTESTIVATMADISNSTITIGRAIPHVQTYILDKWLQPVPIGVQGELYIGGAGLAREYLNQPELTAQKFILNPFSDFCNNPKSSRLYKTGDLARYNRDGNIEFLGRIDRQVKIRGFRIEIDEIETIFTRHPAVLEAAIIVVEDTGDKRLVAYVALKQPAEQRELRDFLKQHLPTYMLPAAFVLLAALPHTPNGKIDRRALPAIDTLQIEREAITAPRTITEQILAGIWADVLQTEVGIHDNFFELGGHSLLATQVISRLRKAFEIELPLRNLFEAPTIASLAESIEQMRRSEQGFHDLPLVPVSRHQDLPLSFAQKRLWLLEQLQPGNAAYHIPAAIQIQGQLNIPALAASFNEIIRRHEALRTVFIAEAGNPVQVVIPSLNLELPIIDLSSLPEQREAEVLQLANEAAQQPFNLEQAPLLRISLLQLGEAEYILLLTMHHIISDGWSIGVFIREMAELYVAFAAGKPLTLASPPIQYADFASWQQQWLQGEVLEAHASYWKQKLGGNLPILELQSDRPRPKVQNFQGARESLILPKDLHLSLKTLSQKQEVSLFITLLAVFKILLYRLSGQEDIIVGSPVANRNRAEIEGLIGCFVNTLVLRSDLAGNPSFSEFLTRVRSVVLEAQDHQDMPFEKLVEELQLVRDLSRNPLFDVMLNFVNTPETALELPGLSLNLLDQIELESKFLMTLYVEEENGFLKLQLVYQSAVFSSDRMACFLKQYQYLLEQVVADVNQPIDSYSLVTPDLQILPDPSAVLAEPQPKLVTNMFADWAKRTPQQVAICQGEHFWTYSQLAETALTIAKFLHRTQPGEAIAVCGSRSFGLIASIIGILQSGGVLLTLDSNLSSYRQQIMLQAANVKHVLYVGARRQEDDWMRESIAITDVAADTGLLLVDSYPNLEAVELPEIAPDAPAYIFFTSGTTGIPKGVLGSHKGLGHFLQWQQQTFAIAPQDRSAQLTGLSFDVVLRDIFLPLTSGATLCLLEDSFDIQPDKIIAWLLSERISLLHTVPALAQSWLVNIPFGNLHSLRWVFFAGEPLTETLVNRWRKAFSGSGIVNLYGPTETTLAKCYYIVPEAIAPGVQPVGWTLPQTQALVLGHNKQLCGIGEPGEIVLRTPFCSLGYINAELEQQTRFVPNYFRKDAQDLLYYTGDRGRYLLDGSLEILGRLDRQVKIRGVRIELGEIESVFSQHPAVVETVVTCREDIPGQKRLVAYVVLKTGETLTIGKLRNFVKQQLPEYMLPSVLILLDALPLTANGKINRQALPIPDTNRPELEAAFVAPRNPVEKEIAAIWAEVLGLEQVGIDDNFFELGGHSLLATQVISRMRKVLNVDLPLRTLFETPTVAGIAAATQAQQQQSPDTINKITSIDTEQLLTDIDQLSEKEVDALLSQMLAE
ncbi:amino acid adenylation domain-containing protein [Nostoc sp. XA010]|uniref:non-ribosomal peptide synthetase n=1 Tax=Nostoc sp. XA010 TaxID=2780407 RepID=UPI001E5163BE|nr:non-ribosomal peptide synthetase [Nostoc sp. XA010]MCC5661302.1 amino acid adenylation domain-containing protein [Nostoc sp. XA010]